MKHRVSNDNEDLELNQTVLVDLHVCAILTQFWKDNRSTCLTHQRKRKKKLDFAANTLSDVRTLSQFTLKDAFKDSKI
jgi:hypothetical protein